MSRNPKPTTEELRFVYDLILKGYEESDILAEYARLYQNGTLLFPYRTDKRFIRDRKRELESASQVLEEHIKRRVDPIISKRKDEHYQQLAEIVLALLADGLETATEHVSTRGEASYTIWSNGVGHKILAQELVWALGQNVDEIYSKYTDFDVECLIQHLEAEYSDIESFGLHRVIKENPYELIAALRVLARRKTFKGTCPVCKDWQGV